MVVAGAERVAQQELQGHRLRELGGAAKAAGGSVILCCQLLECAVHAVGRQEGGFSGGEQAPVDRLHQVLGVLLHVLCSVVEGVGHADQYPAKAGHLPVVFRRKVGASIEGQTLRSEEHGHRPAAAPGKRLHCRHIDAIQVGPLFPVHFDVDKVFVHNLGGVGVLKGLPFHHVAPVTGRISYAEEDRFVLGMGAFQRLGAPGIPIHRVIGMLEQIRTGLVDQAVGHNYLRRRQPCS